MLALGLDGADAAACLPGAVQIKKGEHSAAFLEPAFMNSPLRGIAPADVHNRDPREIAVVSGGATLIGNGVLAKSENAYIVFCQLVPWQFEHDKHMNQKRTFRRASCLVTRLAANLGVAGSTPVLALSPRGRSIRGRAPLAGRPLP